MAKRFAPNITTSGRVARALVALLLLAAGIWLCLENPWVGALVIACGLFVLFEALRGWCVMRACGLKTKM